MVNLQIQSKHNRRGNTVMNIMMVHCQKLLILIKDFEAELEE